MPFARVPVAVWAVACVVSPANGTEPTVALVAKRYQLDVVTHASAAVGVRTSHGRIDGAAADPADRDSYAALFAAEWSLYPPNLVRRTGLKRVVFCRDLRFDGQPRTGVPDYEHATLYLDVSRGRHDDRYVRRVIHHEFFHFVDLMDDGLVYADERWAALNPPGFRYGGGGARFQHDPTATLLGRELPGFLNRYATAGVEEDKAELFAYLMVEPRVVEERAARDRYLRAKVERMKELLAAFAPEADAGFWAAVRAARLASPP